MKLRNLQSYKTNDIPDHLIEEINQLSAEIIKAIMPLINKHSPNIVLGSFNFLHAAIIKELISDDHEELKKAAIYNSCALIKNLELLGNFKIFEDE